MDKKINIDLVMKDNPLDPVCNIVNRISTKVAETNDEFIFTTVSDWWFSQTQYKISKKHLIDALTKQRPVKPCIAREDDEFYWKCGTCFKSMRGFDYCPHCGQKVDWDDERT